MTQARAVSIWVFLPFFFAVYGSNFVPFLGGNPKVT